MIDFETVYVQRSTDYPRQPKTSEILFNSFFNKKKNWFCYYPNVIICGFQRSITLTSSAIRRRTIPNLRNPGKEAGMIQK